MLSKTDLDLLRNFRSQSNPVVSVYLNTDGKAHSKKEVETRLRELSRPVRIQPEPEERREFHRQTIAEYQKIEDHIVKHYKEFNCRGLALFSCSAEDLWHEIELPRPPRDRVIVSDAPFIRPLQFQEVEYHPYCTVVLDRNSAKILLIYKGAFQETIRVIEEAPQRDRHSGRSDYGEERAHRKGGAQVGGHLKHVAEALFKLHQRQPLHWLILGCKPEYLHEFEQTLHSYLRERVAAHLDLAVDTPDHEILDRSLKIERSLVFKEHCRVVEKLQHTIQAGGMAVSGLEQTLRYLNVQAVESLLVARDFQLPGVYCDRCHFLGILETVCPVSGDQMLETPDVVTLAIDRALNLNCEVQQVYEGVGMDKLGQIGAFIRYRL